MSLPRALLPVAIMFLAGCASATPNWTMAGPSISSEGLSVTSVSYPCPSERAARESALQGALTEFLRYTGVEVTSYLQMVTRETSRGQQPSLVAMENTDTTTLATQGFVKKVKQQAWHKERDNSGMFVAYVQVLVPSSEVARVEAEQKALREAKTAPLRAARTAFATAIAQHRLGAAAQMIPDLMSLSEAAGPLALTREQLVGQIQDGLIIQPCSSPQFDLDRDAQALVAMCVKHNGQGVPNFPLVVTLPSGVKLSAVTGIDGRTTMALPSPAHPGSYPLVAASGIKELPGTALTFSLQVVGGRKGLSNGQFHDFIEARGTASADARYTNRHQAEQIALQTARQLAFARLLELRDGLSLTARTEVSGHDLIDHTVSSETFGHIEAQPVEEIVTWSGAKPQASVVYSQALRTRRTQ